jgi:hypothetical protein
VKPPYCITINRNKNGKIVMEIEQQNLGEMRNSEKNSRGCGAQKKKTKQGIHTLQEPCVIQIDYLHESC